MQKYRINFNFEQKFCGKNEFACTSYKVRVARIKFLGMFICALCKMQSVSYEKLKTAFETDANSASSLRRIQRFFAEYMLDYDLIARLVFKMLPHQPPYRLAIDRTNWKFGETNKHFKI